MNYNYLFSFLLLSGFTVHAQTEKKQECKATTKKESSVTTITTDAKKKVTGHKGLVVLKVHALWCPPCRNMKPIFEDVAQQFADNSKVLFAQVEIDSFDADESVVAWIKKEYGKDVGGIPLILLIKDGKIIDEITGSCSADTLKTKVNKTLKS